jgi:hypothetical protein
MTNPGGNIFDAPTHSTVGEEDYRHPANPASYRPGDPREPRPQPDYTAEPKNPEAQHLPVPHGVALHPNVIAPPATGPTKAPRRRGNEKGVSQKGRAARTEGSPGKPDRRSTPKQSLDQPLRRFRSAQRTTQLTHRNRNAPVDAASPAIQQLKEKRSCPNVSTRDSDA